MLSTSQVAIHNNLNHIHDFYVALTSQNVDVIRATWYGRNPLFCAWYRGAQIRFGYDQFAQPDIRTISFNELIRDFKLVLSSQCIDIIQAIWNGNPLLRAWYSGKKISFGYDQFGKPDKRGIPLDDLIHDFKFALSSKSVDIIKAMWDGNPLLRAWYCGRKIGCGYNPAGQPNMLDISPNNLISAFSLALSSGNLDIIKAMWSGNPLLGAWYKGKQINFGYNEFGQPDIRIISFNELIRDFEFALSIRDQNLITALWKENEVLHNAINYVGFDQSKVLLKKVMSSNYGINDFITSYVNCLNNTSVISAVLKDMKAHHSSRTMIDLLQIRLDTIQHTSQISLADARVSTNMNNQFTTILTQTNPSQKRKALPNTSPSKKQRTETNTEVNTAASTAVLRDSGENNHDFYQDPFLDTMIAEGWFSTSTNSSPTLFGRQFEQKTDTCVSRKVTSPNLDSDDAFEGGFALPSSPETPFKF